MNYEKGCGSFEEDGDGWDQVLTQINSDNMSHPATQTREAHTYTFEGVRVNFPYPAYKSQVEMMEKIIQGAYHGENCLLESPTGTGKTAALLCALLAWRKACIGRRYNCHDVSDKAAKEEGACSCGLITNPENTKVIIQRVGYAKKLRLKAVKIKSMQRGNLYPDNNEMETSQRDEDGSSPNKMKKIGNKKKPEEVVTAIKEASQLCRYCVKKYLRKHEPPKIYYSTRTHSQIAQVVEQLKNTAYSDVKMTILSSRKVTCINELVQEDPQTERVQKNERNNLDDRCRTLRKNVLFNLGQEKKPEKERKKPRPVCRYYKIPENFKSKFSPLQNNGVWDIEELIQHGKKKESCPYYGSQALHETAEIIFCPYNYLISPGIRESVKIELVNNIVVFDEAHNIEDICRDTASLSIDRDRLDGWIRLAFDKPLHDASSEIGSSKRTAADHFSLVLQNLSTWMAKNAPKVKEPNIYNSEVIKPAATSFLSKDMITAFSSIGLGPDTIADQIEFYNALCGRKPKTEQGCSGCEDSFDSESETTPQDDFKVGSEGLQFVDELLKALEFLYTAGNLEGYKVVLVNTGIPTVNTHLPKVSDTADNIIRRQKLVLDILCLNPAIAFKPIKNAAHSIIVTSGTLTPLDSFAGELNTPFPITLSASHVVKSSQVWAGIVKCGPSKNFELNLSKGFQHDPETQDEIGNAILKICEVIPHGVIVFFPSYSFMNILRTRWSQYPVSNPLLRQLKILKIVYFEESKSKEVFQKDMEEYKTNINSPNSNGCLLFAIFRGKVSEGIDFKDDQARAVISVGIPFANFGAPSISSKRAYNDIKRREITNKDLLSGDDWYTTAAFRAMNQGLGRCLRHKGDWGAIILLDCRLVRYRKYISKWVQDYIQTFEIFEGVVKSLTEFVDEKNHDFNLSDEDTQLIEYQNVPTQLTQPFHLATTSPKVDCDSSAYSLDEFDSSFGTKSTAKICKSNKSRKTNFHELPTQKMNLSNMNTSSDSSEICDVSYHSSNSFMDFMEHTP